MILPPLTQINQVRILSACRLELRGGKDRDKMKDKLSTGSLESKATARGLRPANACILALHFSYQADSSTISCSPLNPSLLELEHLINRLRGSIIFSPSQSRVREDRNTIMDILTLPLSTLPPLSGLILFFAVYLMPAVLGKRKYSLPPGPPGEFILGHYRKIPFVAAFKQYAQWGKEYGMSAYHESYSLK